MTDDKTQEAIDKAIDELNAGGEPIPVQSAKAVAPAEAKEEPKKVPANGRRKAAK